MSSWLTKLNVYVFAPAVTIAVNVPKLFPFTDDYKKAHPFIPWLVDVFVLVGTLTIYINNILIPYKKYEKSVGKKYKLLDELVKELNAEYPLFKFTCNVMFLKHRYWLFIEPRKDKAPNHSIKWLARIFKKRRANSNSLGKRRFMWSGNVLEIVYGEAVHPKFKLTENQGICGEAIREAKNTSIESILGQALTEGSADNDFNFNEEQKRMTKGLCTVISCPLIIREREGDQQKVTRLGVLNLESKEEASKAIFLKDNEGAKIEIFTKIERIGKTFINLHV